MEVLSRKDQGKTLNSSLNSIFYLTLFNTTINPTFNLMKIQFRNFNAENYRQIKQTEKHLKEVKDQIERDNQQIPFKLKEFHNIESKTNSNQSVSYIPSHTHSFHSFMNIIFFLLILFINSSIFMAISLNFVQSLIHAYQLNNQIVYYCQHLPNPLIHHPYHQ